MLIMGSYALHKLGKNNPAKKFPKDLDIISSLDDYNLFCRTFKQHIEKAYPMSAKKFHVKFKNSDNPTKVINVEFEITWDNSTAKSLWEIYRNNPETTTCEIGGLSMMVADVNTCYALKMSHRFLRNSPHFMKTMRDIHYLRSIGATIPDSLQEWYVEREKETYWYKHPKLDQGKGDFFKDDGINYVYDHDTIHLAVKRFELPAYEYFKADDAEVLCSKDKWDALPEEIKLSAVLEESMVLAIERCLVPFNFTTEPKKAFLMALSKVCSSITSGWFRSYGWENFDKVVALYSDDYVDKFKAALEAGEIKPFTGKNY